MIALILARGGSKCVPKKNIKQLMGKPLIEYVITSAKESKKITDVYYFHNILLFKVKLKF